MRSNMHIEIVSSTVVGLSSMSARSRAAAQSVLSKHYAHVSSTIINNLSDLERLVARRPDLVFLGMKFLPMKPMLGSHDSGKIWIGQYLDRCGIAHTGSSHVAHNLERNKPLAKQCVRRAGLATAPFLVLRNGKPFSRRDITLKYPLFIKPADRAGGCGVDAHSLVHTFEELHAKVESISVRLHADSLIEEYLPGREFSVAILADTRTTAVHVMPIELRAAVYAGGESVLSQAVKSANMEEVLLVNDRSLREKINSLAFAAYLALGARDYGRIDIRLDSTGEPQFLEANLIPSLIEGYGSFPKACRINMHMSYETMLLRIVRLALQRTKIANIQYLPVKPIVMPSPDIAFTFI